MLKQCAVLLRQGVHSRDTVARLGGDEFGIFFKATTRAQVLAKLEKLIIQVSAYRFFHNQQSFNVGFSAGIVRIDQTFGSTEDIFACADLSCYTAKERGRGGVHVYEALDEEITHRRLEMRTATEIQQAISDKRFVVHAQPIVSLVSPDADPVHYELLVRMLRTDGEIIAPGFFIAAAERYNLASSIDEFVLDTAFSELTKKIEAGVQRIPSVTVNLSGSSLGDRAFCETVASMFKQYSAVPADHICFEVTETSAIRNLDVATQFIDRMKFLGCKFALDDFGTGLSSFSYLKDLGVDIIKIDGVFIRDICTNPVNRAVVSSICEVARSLDRKVVAECVEDVATVSMLTALGVDYGQGYVWSKPVPFDEVLDTFV